MDTDQAINLIQETEQEVSAALQRMADELGLSEMKVRVDLKILTRMRSDDDPPGEYRVVKARIETVTAQL